MASPDPTSVEGSVAAVDLGSNSFHLVVGRRVGGRFRVVDRLRERVALAAGLDAKGRLGAKARARALACLGRFGQRLREMPAGSVRAVGTNTFRKARGLRDFLELASKELGHPIEVISGREEARLVYQGVTSQLSGDQGSLLVVDIGGGSTELVIGEGPDVALTESLYMGCVELTERFFEDGQLSRKRCERARLAARQELQPVKRSYRRLGWETCLGSSGTAAAVASLLSRDRPGPPVIERSELFALWERVGEARRVADLELEGIGQDRRSVLPGGLAILVAVFEALHLDRMGVAGGALREGIVTDLLGRIHDEDFRDGTIQAFQARFSADQAQAKRIERTAQRLFKQVATDWELDGSARRVLRWAARLHEIGLSVAHAGHHRHAAYLLEHSDMPGFARAEQALLATIVGGHRRKLRPEAFEMLGETQGQLAWRLCVLLRLSCCLHRSRSPSTLPETGLQAKGERLRLSLPADWLEEHPLTRADLLDDAQSLARAGFELELVERTD
ncbi:MAG: exopolyphosphatase [Acidobacteriota bacterium]